MQGSQANGSTEFDVQVFTTQNRGFTPEELADRALDKLIEVSDTADPIVKAQAMVYKERIRQLMIFYMYESIQSYKTTLCAELTKQGHASMAQIIKKL
jgi:dsDNA-binding SOS-regulon protein